MAIGLKAVFGATDPTWLAKSVASIFVLVALFIFWSARKQACASYDRLSHQHAEVQGRSNFTAMTIALSTGTVATGVILWLI